MTEDRGKGSRDSEPRLADSLEELDAFISEPYAEILGRLTTILARHTNEELGPQEFEVMAELLPMWQHEAILTGGDHWQVFKRDPDVVVPPMALLRKHETSAVVFGLDPTSEYGNRARLVMLAARHLTARDVMRVVEAEKLFLVERDDLDVTFSSKIMQVDAEQRHGAELLKRGIGDMSEFITGLDLTLLPERLVGIYDFDKKVLQHLGLPMTEISEKLGCPSSIIDLSIRRMGFENGLSRSQVVAFGYFSGQIDISMLPAKSKALLSDIERRVLKSILCTNEQIAEYTGVNANKIKDYYIPRIRSKLGTTEHIQMYLIGLRDGYIDPYDEESVPKPQAEAASLNMPYILFENPKELQGKREREIVNRLGQTNTEIEKDSGIPHNMIASYINVICMRNNMDEPQLIKAAYQRRLLSETHLPDPRDADLTDREQELIERFHKVKKSVINELDIDGEEYKKLWKSINTKLGTTHQRQAYIVYIRDHAGKEKENFIDDKAGPRK